MSLEKCYPTEKRFVNVHIDVNYQASIHITGTLSVKRRGTERNIYWFWDRKGWVL